MTATSRGVGGANDVVDEESDDDVDVLEMLGARVEVVADMVGA
jgi:hypothetical protein